MKKENRETETLPQKSVFQKLGVYHPVLEYRTPFEKSEYSCLENILRGTIKSFLIGYGIRGAISLVMTLVKFKKIIQKPSLLIKALFNGTNLRFGSFLACHTGLLKSFITIFRLITKKDQGVQHFLSGFLASYFSSFIWEKNTRSLWGVFALSRAFDTVYNHLVNSGKIKKRGANYAVIFVFVQLLGCYAFGYEPYLLPNSLEKFYVQMTAMNKNDNIFRHLWAEITRRRLKRDGIIKDIFILE